MAGLGAGNSDIDIVSQALVLLGEAPISSLTEGTAGQVATSLLETTRNQMLQANRWRFAAGKATLSRLTATPKNEWTYAFQLPSDLLLLYRVYPFTSYEVYEDKLYSDQATIEVDYLFDPGPGDYPSYFVEALVARLAAKMAIPITNNASLLEIQEARAKEAMAAALFADSQGRPNRPIEHHPWIRVRG